MNLTTIVSTTVLVLIGLVIAAIISCLIAVLVMLCWNFVIPTVFGFPKITWRMAWCLTFLCQLLLRSQINVKS